MHQFSRFVVWICRKFNREEIEKIVSELSLILKNPSSKVKPMGEGNDDQLPNYRDFRPDSMVPLNESQLPSKKKRKRKNTSRKSFKNT